MFEFLIIFLCAGSGLFFLINSLVEMWASRGRDAGIADRELSQQGAGEPRTANGWNVWRSIRNVTQAIGISGHQRNGKEGYR